MYQGKQDQIGSSWDNRGMVASRSVVVSNHSIASTIGLEVLAIGGNAVDAAIATLIALTVVEPMMVSPSGGGVILIYLADKKRTIFIDNYAAVPKSLSVELLLSLTMKDGDHGVTNKFRSIATPGALKGWGYAIRKYGRLPFARLFDSAIRLAENGFPASPYFVDCIRRWQNEIRLFPETSSIYLPNGDVPQVGDLIIQKDLAQTLQLIAREGPNVMYTGCLARKVAEVVAENDGLLSLDDLKSYEVFEREVLHESYRGYDIVTSPLPSVGGAHLIQFLNIVERFPLGDKDFSFGKPQYCHLLTEAHKKCFNDGKIDFSLPIHTLRSEPISKRCALNFGEKISFRRTGQTTKRQIQKPYGKEDSCTTHCTAMDNEGNIVSATQTLHKPFGSKVVPAGTGLLLNDMLNLRDPYIKNSRIYLGGTRIISFMAPTFVFHDQEPLMALGATGGDRIFGSVAQVIINVLDHGMSLQEALDAPRIWARKSELEIERILPQVKKIQTALVEYGHFPVLRARIGAGMNGLLVDKAGWIHGAGCWRSDSVPVGMSGGLARPIESIMSLKLS